MEETRNAKLIVNKSGGTASAAGETFRTTLPSKWVRKMGLNKENRDIQLSFDGETIKITKATDNQ